MPIPRETLPASTSTETVTSVAESRSDEHDAADNRYFGIDITNDLESAVYRLMLADKAMAHYPSDKNHAHYGRCFAEMTAEVDAVLADKPLPSRIVALDARVSAHRALEAAPKATPADTLRHMVAARARLVVANAVLKRLADAAIANNAAYKPFTLDLEAPIEVTLGSADHYTISSNYENIEVDAEIEVGGQTIDIKAVVSPEDLKREVMLTDVTGTLPLGAALDALRRYIIYAGNPLEAMEAVVDRLTP